MSHTLQDAIDAAKYGKADFVRFKKAGDTREMTRIAVEVFERIAAMTHGDTVPVPREIVEHAVRVTQEREEDRYTFGEDKHEITHDLAACLPKKGDA